MYRNFSVMIMFAVLTGCLTTPPTIPNFPLQEKQKASDGYYKYATFWFKGSLENGVPDGKGQCRTRYLIDEYNSDWLDAPCEFRAGERIDRLHQQRSEGSLDFENQKRVDYLQKRKEEEREQARAEAEYKRELARSRAAFEQNMAVSLGNLNQQMIRDHQQMSAMVQRASTPTVPLRTYTPSASTSSSSNSSSRSSNSSSKLSSSSLPKSSDSSSSSSSGGNTNIGEINKKYQTERENNLKAQEQKKLEQQKAYEAKLAKEQKEREEEERQREIQLANEKREKDHQAEKERKEREQLVKKQREEQERNKYLTNVKNNLRLKAVNCYGNNFAVGQIPKGLGLSKHGGIDVHYRAYCSGGGSYSGVSKNFIGMMAGCFGDTNSHDGALIPKEVLSCKASEMTVDVTNVTFTR